MSLTDADLIVRVLTSDDRHAFAELVRRHQSAVRNFARRLTRGEFALADDIAQETFIEAYRSLARYAGGSGLSTWLCGIAYNRFRTHIRRGRRDAVQPSETEAAAHEESAIAPATRSSDLQHDLMLALASLSPAEQAAIHLCYQEGLTHEEAARTLECPLGSLKTSVLRARGKLRHLLRVWAPA